MKSLILVIALALCLVFAPQAKACNPAGAFAAGCGGAGVIVQQSPFAFGVATPFVGGYGVGVGSLGFGGVNVNVGDLGFGLGRRGIGGFGGFGGFGGRTFGGGRGSAFFGAGRGFRGRR